MRYRRKSNRIISARPRNGVLNYKQMNMVINTGLAETKNTDMPRKRHEDEKEGKTTARGGFRSKKQQVQERFHRWVFLLRFPLSYFIHTFLVHRDTCRKRGVGLRLNVRLVVCLPYSPFHIVRRKEIITILRLTPKSFLNPDVIVVLLTS
ncbi:Hypothetical predicted protein [Octopus vulgaris]|uniref:Uncharacterized protein n=1 Tax=Octopus vulgaris TaxID=6645 RepID=A0AA36B8S0_OCTVU|nr:Hypothetical predicted protein [Octopus vulgaris]